MSDTTQQEPDFTARLMGAARVDRVEREQVLKSVQRGLALEEVESPRMGPFTLLRRLGAGGMGVVYAAYDPRLDRRVALKLLHGLGGPRPEAAARLRREAKTLAKLTHPNVVSVHEVGEHDGRTYVAMEFVDGTDLGEWLESETRAVQDVLDKFIPAGKGLAAAHRAGLVHRDFKPANVLVDEDGNVMVADFGLARIASERDVDTQTDGPSNPAPESSASLTRTGVMVGTPAYMAPEQLAGGVADTRSDQYAFCVALYEALFGRRPFKARSIEQLAVEIQAGPTEPPANSPVPGWLRQAVMRGLSTEPEDRYPSMDALIADLTRDRSARTRKVALALAVVGLAAAAGWLVTRGDAQECSGVATRVREIWNPARRRVVAEAFVATGHPDATAIAAGLAERVDAYVAAWTQSRRGACTATHVDASQSEALLDRQVLCLERGLLSLDATLSRLAAADRELVSRAYDPILSIEGVEACTAESVLLDGVPRPTQADIRAELIAVDEQWAEAAASRGAGHLREGREQLEKAFERATAAGHAPTEARLAFDTAFAVFELDEHQTALTWVRLAVRLADRGSADVTRARALALLARSLARIGRGEEAAETLEQSRAAFARLGAMRLEWAFILDTAAGSIAMEADDWPSALSHYSRVIDASERAPAEQLDWYITAVSNLGAGALERGMYNDALRWHQLSHAAVASRHGEHHPDAAKALSGIGACHFRLGDIDTAVQAFERSLEIRLAYMPADDPRMAAIYQNLGVGELARDHYAAALARFEQALALVDPGRGVATRPALLTNLGSVHTRRGDFVNALEFHRQSLELRLADPTTTARKLADSHYAVANDLLELGRLDDALEAHTAGYETLVEATGARDPSVAEHLLGMAEVLIALRRPAAALDRTQAAYAFVEHPDVNAELRAGIEFATARAMLLAGRPRAEAMPFAESAWNRVRGFDPANPRRKRIERWLHPTDSSLATPSAG